LVAAHDALPARDIEPDRQQAPHLALLTCSDARIAENRLHEPAVIDHDTDKIVTVE
jgi:carbonic anhydrase